MKRTFDILTLPSSKGLIVFAICMTVASIAFADVNAVDTVADKSVGTPEAIIQQVIQTDVRSTGTFSFDSSQGQIPVAVRDYYYKDGELSMSGGSRTSKDPAFILKGNAQKLYGWVVLNAQNKAYKYTTNDDGIVVSSAALVTDIYPICNLDHSPPDKIFQQDANWFFAHVEPHIGEYEGEDLQSLQSLPGAEKVFYLDITRVMNGDTPIDFPKEEMWKTWQNVASSLSMYEVNITTDPAVYEAAGIPNSGIARFMSQDGRANAPVNSFGTAQYSSLYTTASSEPGQGWDLGRTSSHEIGHQLGLMHDGSPGQEYHLCIPEFKWCPIMGNYYQGSSWKEEGLYTWSKGEYTDASNTEDDLALIEAHLPFREDDIPDSIPLVIDGEQVSPEENYGQIAANTDSDAFTFSIASGGGHVTLNIDRIEYVGGAMLDVDAEIFDSSDASVAQSNNSVARNAEFDLDLDEGAYTLVIKGGAEGTPQNGFSNYSSLGFYAIEGTITGADSETDTDDDTGGETDSDDENGDTDSEEDTATEGDDDDDDDDDNNNDDNDDTGDDDDDNDDNNDNNDDDNDNNDNDDDDDDNNDNDNDDNNDDDTEETEASDPSGDDGCGCGLPGVHATSVRIFQLLF